MLMKMLQDESGFIANERVNGALFKADISGIPDNLFSSGGIGRLTEGLDISFRNIKYVKPRMDTPCMYGACTILQDSIPVESHYSWKDLKALKRNKGGIFVINIEVDGELSAQPRLLTSWHVENLPIDRIKMSPLLRLLAQP